MDNAVNGFVIEDETSVKKKGQFKIRRPEDGRAFKKEIRDSG